MSPPPVSQLIEQEINAYFRKSPGEYNRYEAELRDRFTRIAEAAAREALNHPRAMDRTVSVDSIVQAVLGAEDTNAKT